MRIFTCTNFKGHYPVGAAAVIVANTEAEAETLLELELERIGLPQERHWQPELIELSPNFPGATILVNGDY